MVGAGWLTVHVAGMLACPVPLAHVWRGEVQVRPTLFLPRGGEGEVQVMSSRWVVNSAKGINTRPLQLRIGTYKLHPPLVSFCT